MRVPPVIVCTPLCSRNHLLDEENSSPDEWPPCGFSKKMTYPSKIKLEKVKNFQRQKSVRQLTTIHQQLTTTSPQSTIKKTQFFRDPPSKTPINRRNTAAHHAQNFF
jgi:hypothetical protein